MNMKNLIIRSILIMSVYILTQLNLQINYSDIILVLILVFGLLLTYLEDRENHIFNTISNYLFWLVTTFIILLDKKEHIFNIKNIFLVVFIIKTLGVIFTYYKFRRIEVPTTILNKIWVFTLFVYLSELILNSTHGTKNYFFYIGLISSIETFLILFKLRNWQFKVKSILTL